MEEEKAIIYGYVRAAIATWGWDGDSLESQIHILEKCGCWQIIQEAFNGKTMECSKLQALRETLREGKHPGGV